MALLKFFKLKDKLHDTTEASVLSKMEVEAANKQVSNALQSAAEKVSRGKYNSYTPQQRAKIGKYAAENGPTKATKHFTAIWGIHVNESTARRLKSEYLGKLKEVVSEVKSAVGAGGETKSKEITVDTLKNSEQTADSFLGTRPITRAPEFLMATA